jgi:hypothetical protein
MRRHTERNNLMFYIVLVKFRRRVAAIAIKDKQMVYCLYLRFYIRIKVLNITDLISAVVELLERDMSRLVVEVREALEPVEL